MEYIASAMSGYVDPATVANKRAAVGAAGAARYRASVEQGDLERLLKSDALGAAFKKLTKGTEDRAPTEGRALWKPVDLLHLKMQSPPELGKSLPADLAAIWSQLHLSALPRLGLGTFAMYSGLPDEAVATRAYEHGCRMFDFFDPTHSGLLHDENNVRRLGDELRGKDLRDIVLISKPDFMSLGCLKTQFDACVSALGEQPRPSDQPLIDVYMMHYPLGLHQNPEGELVPTESFCLKKTWKQMEELVRLNKVRSLGVSNFSIAQLNYLLDHVCTIKPCVHQFEHHPFSPWPEMVALCHERGIACMASSPLAGGAVQHSKSMRSAAEDITSRLSGGLTVTPTQATLLWNIAQHVSVLPGVADVDHISENFSTLSMPRLQPWQLWSRGVDAPNFRISKMKATFPHLMAYMNRHGDFVEEGECVKCVRTVAESAAAQYRLLACLPDLAKNHMPDDAIETIAQTQAIVSTFKPNEPVDKRRRHIAEMTEKIPQEKAQLSPMVVVSLADFEQHGKVPRRTLDRESWQRDVRSLSPDAKVIFISQRWLTPASPDDASNQKFHSVVAASKTWAKWKKCPLEHLYLWMDWPCVCQDALGGAADMARFENKEGVRAINSLGLYVASCDGFVVIDHEQYWTRGWCRVELMFGDAAQTSMLTYKQGRNTVEEIGLEQLGTLAPQQGKLSHESDRPTIAKLVQVAELMKGRLAHGDFRGKGLSAV